MERGGGGEAGALTREAGRVPAGRAAAAAARRCVRRELCCRGGHVSARACDPMGAVLKVGTVSPLCFAANTWRTPSESPTPICGRHRNAGRKGEGVSCSRAGEETAPRWSCL